MTINNLLFKVAKSRLLDKWLTILAENPDGQILRTIVYCRSVRKYKGLCFIPVSPDVLVEGYKIKHAEIFDFGYIDNYVFHYFKSMLHDLTSATKKKDSLFDLVLFTICYYMLLDENLYGDDNEAAMDYLVNEAFPYLIESQNLTARRKKMFKVACADIYHELCSSLSIEEKSF